MRHLIIGFHVGDLLFDELEVRDRLALNLARIRIRHRRIAGRADDAGRSRRNRVTSILEREHRDLESFAFLPEHVLFRNPNVLQ